MCLQPKEEYIISIVHTVMQLPELPLPSKKSILGNVLHCVYATSQDRNYTISVFYEIVLLSFVNANLYGSIRSLVLT